MKITPRSTAIALALAMATVLSAQTPAETPKAPSNAIDFTALDANKDGLVSMNEVQFVDDLKGSFDALDANSDANLSPTEFAHWGRAGKTKDALPLSPSTGPSGSNGSQHMPSTK